MIINPEILVPTITSFTLLPFLLLSSCLPSWVNGDSPGGVPSLEYLGIGYNAITGNPRGTETSNIDPGFRASVIKLVKDENVLSMDTDYAIPLGTELRYITSCEYSSKASEVSSSSSYQRELRSTVESSFSKSTNESTKRDESGSSSAGGSFLGIGGKTEKQFKFSRSSEISQDVFFSGSELYREFVKQEQETEVTSFESQGVCTEFEAHLKKYYNHVLQESFLRGLATLPVPYDKDDESHVLAYSDFVSTYGTHYVSRLSLGARTVFSSSMSRSSVKDLQNQNIDIASSFNFRTAQKLSSSSEETKSKSGSAIFVSGGSSNTVSVSNYQSSEVTNTGSTSINLELNTERQVAEKITSIKEFNVGGLPAVGYDWKSWARSVGEKPMPISYDITPLWSLLDNECAAKSLYDAIVDIYSLDFIGVAEAPDIGSGIVRSNSEPAISYSETDIFGRYTYASGPITRYTNKKGVSLNTYNVTLQGTFNEATSPLFATMISGSIGPEGDSIDLNSIPFLKKDLIVSMGLSGTLQENINTTITDETFSPFLWRSKTVGEKLSLGVLTKESINGSNAVDTLNSFSYLAIPSLDSNSRAIIGVVNPDGTPVRKKSFSQLGYSVARDGYGTWKISFDKEFEEPPSLIAQPMWISSVENMPKSSSQVSLAVRECTTKECIVYLGCNSFLSSYDPIKQKLFYDMVENELENKYHRDHLGIAFLAIDGNFTIPSVIHGIVTDNIFFNNGTILGKGWTALKKTSTRMTDTFTWSDKQGANELHYDQAFHWIEIEFDAPFLEAPSLIITPYFGLETKQNRVINWQNRFLNENPFTDIAVYNNSESIGHVKTVPFASVEYI